MPAHDLELVEQLFRQYYKVLRAYAFKMVSDPDTAEDIVQDVFVALWDKQIQLDTGRPVKSYLFRAVYNKSVNYLASKKYTEEDSLELFVDQLNVLRVQETNQENLFMMKELQEEIRLFATRLPPQVQRVFALSRTHGLKIAEIAELMNLSHKTVEKYLTRALADLRRYLRERGLLSVLLFLYLRITFF